MEKTTAAYEVVRVIVGTKVGKCHFVEKQASNLVSEEYFWSLLLPLDAKNKNLGLLTQDHLGQTLFNLGQVKLSGKLGALEFSGTFVVVCHPDLNQRCTFDLVLGGENTETLLTDGRIACSRCGSPPDQALQLQQANEELARKARFMKQMKRQLGEIIQVPEKTGRNGSSGCRRLTKKN